VQRSVDADALELGAQVHGVEGPVVCDHDPTLEEVDEVGGDLVERGGSTDLRGADAVDGLGPQVSGDPGRNRNSARASDMCRALYMPARRSTPTRHSMLSRRPR